MYVVALSKQPIDLFELRDYCSDIYVHTVYTDYLYDRQGHQKGLGDFFCLKKPILYSFGNGVIILKVNKMRC